MNDPKILIVEDEEQLLRMLRSTLIHAGYAVVAARTGGEAIDLVGQHDFAIILLDLGLPDMDGKDVIEDIRGKTQARILVISARGSEREKIAALDLGASDYVPKPFDTGELLARIRVALRPAPGNAPVALTGAAGLALDTASRRAVVDGRTVRLSQKETEFLQVLVDAEGGIVGHDEIVHAIWGPNTEADYMNVRVLAWQVRKKIEIDGEPPRFLLSEIGLGYRLNLA